MHRFRQGRPKKMYVLYIASKSLGFGSISASMERSITSGKLSMFSFLLDLIDECYTNHWLQWIGKAVCQKNVYFLNVLILEFGFPHKNNNLDRCLKAAYRAGAMRNIQRILKEATSIDQLVDITRFVNKEYCDHRQIWVKCAVFDRCRELAPTCIPYEDDSETYNNNKHARTH